MDYLRTIKLGYGKGSPGKQACWMSALSAHLGGEWTDQLSCVDPVINQLCIKINDLYGSDDVARSEDILTFGLFEPLGTNEGAELTKKRMLYIVDRAVRLWTPLALEASGLTTEATKLRSLPAIVDEATALQAQKVAYAAHATAAAAAYAARAANAAAYAAAAYAAAAYAADAANAAYAAAADAAGKRSFLKQHVYPVLRELIDMGTPQVKEEPGLPKCGVEEFQALVGIVQED